MLTSKLQSSAFRQRLAPPPRNCSVKRLRVVCEDQQARKGPESALLNLSKAASAALGVNDLRAAGLPERVLHLSVSLPLHLQSMTAKKAMHTVAGQPMGRGIDQLDVGIPHPVLPFRTAASVRLVAMVQAADS